MLDIVNAIIWAIGAEAGDPDCAGDEGDHDFRSSHQMKKSFPSFFHLTYR